MEDHLASAVAYFRLVEDAAWRSDTDRRSVKTCTGVKLPQKELEKATFWKLYLVEIRNSRIFWSLNLFLDSSGNCPYKHASNKNDSGIFSAFTPSASILSLLLFLPQHNLPTSTQLKVIIVRCRNPTTGSVVAAERTVTGRGFFKWRNFEGCLRWTSQS